MAKIQMTYSLAQAIAKDAGNAHMRKHGRKVWDVDDYNVSVFKFHKLWPCPGGAQCDICTEEEHANA